MFSHSADVPFFFVARRSAHRYREPRREPERINSRLVVIYDNKYNVLVYTGQVGGLVRQRSVLANGPSNARTYVPSFFAGSMTFFPLTNS
jgi:hypothetical protein